VNGNLLEMVLKVNIYLEAMGVIFLYQILWAMSPQVRVIGASSGQMFSQKQLTAGKIFLNFLKIMLHSGQI
jgi:hypothetical protein